MRKLTLLLLFSTALAVQGAPPKRIAIDYELRRDGAVVAEVSDRLEHDGKTYQLSEVWRGKGLYALRGEAKRSSRGAVAADGLRPEVFEDQRPGRETKRIEPQARAQDRLSVLWHFAFAPPAQRVTLSVADRRGPSTHTYEPSGRERVTTPAGEFSALKLLRKDDDRRTQVWLAAERGHVPVRILVTEKDGTTLDLVAVRILP